MTTDRTVHRLDERGSVRDWLVSPAWSEPVDDLARHLDSDGSPWGPRGRWVLTNGPDVTPLKQALFRSRDWLPGLGELVVTEGGPASYAGRSGTWQRVHTAADGLVDWSEFCFTPEYRLALAATVLEVDQAEWRTLRLAATGPTRLFLDGRALAEDDTVSYMEPVEREVRVWLPSRTSTLVVASWQVAFRECRHVIRLRVGGLPVRVVIPSEGADEYVAAAAEQLLDAVGVTRWGSATAEVPLTGPEGARLRVDATRVEVKDHKAVVRLRGATAADSAAADGAVGSASMLATGELDLRVSVDDAGAPVYRSFPVAVLPRHHRTVPVGDATSWRHELLSHVATFTAKTAGVLAGAALTEAALAGALDLVNRRGDCADFEALGLLHVWHRVPAAQWPPGLRDRVATALTGFKYWIDQPGLDAMCYFTENHQLVWHVAETLVGEAFGDETFTNTGWSGAKHAEHGRALARDWIERRLAGGFSEFDSNAYLAIDLLALVSLVEFCRDETLVELAAGLADVVLFSLAANSWRGIHGAAHGRSYVQTLRSSRLEETAPIMWLCFGVGALNDAVLPATVLATARRYAVPPAISAVATDNPELWWGRQSHRGRYRFAHDLLDRPYGSDTVVYRTPDVMLASAVDYRVGLPGLQEHVWGATLGPETQIFATHPANASSSPSARPNAWAGNRILPRVAQERETLIALYAIPADDPMGSTHAWFPIAHLDEWTRRGVWTVGRRGDGYVALATEGGSEPVTTGPDAAGELRPLGSGRAWVCTVGRRATHGSFSSFVAGLAEPQFGRELVRFGGLELGWTGPFTVDGRPAEPGHRWPRVDNPACRLHHGDDRMVITAGNHEHVIDLHRGRSVPGGSP